MPKRKIIIDSDDEDDQTAASAVPHLLTTIAPMKSSSLRPSIHTRSSAARSSSAQDFRSKKGIPIAEDIWSIVGRDPPSFHIEVQRYIDEHTPEEFVDDVIRGTPNSLLVQLEQTTVDMDKLAEGRASDTDPELRTITQDRGTYLVWARPMTYTQTTLRAALTGEQHPRRSRKKAAFYAGKGSSGHYGIHGRAIDHTHADTEMIIHRLIRENDLDPIVMVS